MLIDVEKINKGFRIYDIDNPTDELVMTVYPFRCDDFPLAWKGQRRYTFNRTAYQNTSQKCKNFYSYFKEIYFYFYDLYLYPIKKSYIENLLDNFDCLNYAHILQKWLTIDEKDYQELGNCQTEILKKHSGYCAYKDEILKAKYPEYKKFSRILNFNNYLEYHDKPYFKRAYYLFETQKQQEQEFKNKIEKMLEIVEREGMDKYLDIHKKRFRKDDFITILIAFKNLTNCYEQYIQLLNNDTLKLNYKDYKNCKDIAQKTKFYQNKINEIIENEENALFAKNQSMLPQYEDDTYKIIIPTKHSECELYGERLNNCLGGFEWHNYLKNGIRLVYIVEEKTTGKLVACIDVTYKNKCIQQKKSTP